MNLLDRDQVLRLFDELSEELVRRGTRAEIFLVGGAAMALAYDARRATRDIDAVFQPKEEVYSAASVVAARHDLPDDWLNGEVKGFLSGDDPQARLVYESQALRVDVASPGVPPGDEAACRSRAGRSGHRFALPVVWLHHRCRGSGPRGVGVPGEGDRAEGSVPSRGVLRFHRRLDLFRMPRPVPGDRSRSPASRRL